LTSRCWEDLVVGGLRLSQAKPPDRWAVGDLCLEAIPPGVGREQRAANQRRLQEFSAATGLSMSLLKDCYRTSQAWKPGSRIPGVSHAKHSKFASRPNRVELLLNDDMADGLPDRIRNKVNKVEELLSDKQARTAVIERSRTRKRRILEAAKVIEDEELTKARTEQRIQEQDLKARLAAPEILSKMDERIIKANLDLARMITALIDFGSVLDHVSPQYHERTVGNLEQIERAARRALDKLRPATRSPRPRTVIDFHVDHQPGAEHR